MNEQDFLTEIRNHASTDQYRLYGQLDLSSRKLTSLPPEIGELTAL